MAQVDKIFSQGGQWWDLLNIILFKELYSSCGNNPITIGNGGILEELDDKILR